MKLAAYRDWRERHGVSAGRVDLEIVIEAAARGNEILFAPDEDWSVRKTLRRMISHELQHTKSIARIVRAYAERFR